MFDAIRNDDPCEAEIEGCGEQSWADSEADEINEKVVEAERIGV